MANLYDFRITIRRAEFDRGMVSIAYGSSADVFIEENTQRTMKDAIARLGELSASEPRAHAAFLTMRYRDDRKAPGIGKIKPIYFNPAKVD